MVKVYKVGIGFDGAILEYIEVKAPSKQAAYYNSIPRLKPGYNYIRVIKLVK